VHLLPTNRATTRPILWLVLVACGALCACYTTPDTTGFFDADADTDTSGIDASDVQPDLGTDTGADTAQDADVGPADTSDADAPDAPGPDAQDAPDAPDTDEPDTPQPSEFTRYFQEQPVSPITPAVVDEMRSIRDASPLPDDLVFMKVGASGTVSQNLLYCFSGDERYDLVWDGRDVYQETVDFFRMGDAAGDTPFDRPTEAAVSGRTASWAITGNPSPVEREIDAINPRFAFVNYGTNDMQQGTTHRSALYPFYENFTELLDRLIAQGIIPILTGLNPRSDRVTAARWVPTYNTVVRGVAEGLQIPFIDIYLLSSELPGLGLLGDGLHGNVYRSNGRGQGCVFDDEGLEFNYNHRNLLSIEALHHVRRTVLEDGPAPDDRGLPALIGDGTGAAPYQIDGLPFTHVASTAGAASSWDAYPACDNGQDESGGERVYRLVLDRPTPIRIGILDRGATDVDLHVLDGPGADDCIYRNDKYFEGPLDAGTYHIAVDTFVSNGNARAGEYLLFVVACEDDDPDCQ
jgi:hypothetical protein